ncbi:AsmA family protein [Stakelama saccharophila]|uniref:AsmA family protein n=1 Tax=Stakelama saccharophila TaxID=3075605 RepID=A0ABZ0B9G1_9SPHN|nr:AsmA family protein [Stakelama sp. W311]WNO53852.1 AsmA family protein [Stakelama sp. W311]
MITAPQPRLVRRGAIGILVLIAVLPLALAAMPWGAFRSLAEDGLSDRYGAPVHIGAMERVGWFGLHPTVRLLNVTIDQPQWAGGGKLLQLRSADIGFPALPVLIGRFRPDALDVRGAKLALVRSAGGRKNWSHGNSDGGAGGSMALDRLAVTDSQITYRDEKQDRSAMLTVRAGTDGLRLTGKGAVHGNPVTIRFAGPPITDRGRWPFKGEIRGDAVGMTVAGEMAHPLDNRHLEMTIGTHAADLRLTDALIEAGLFGTQPVKLHARVSRKGDLWNIRGLSGTIGGSNLHEGHASVDKSGERTRLEGALDFALLDFGDLESDAGKRQKAAERARIGPRLLPDTPIDLRSVDNLDGTLDVRVQRLTAAGGDAVTALSGTLALDHSRLTIDPLVANLVKGTMSGPVTVDQRGRDTPRLTLDFTLSNSSIATFGGGGDFDAPLAGRAKLNGAGATIRKALAQADGSVALFASRGVLPAKLASFIGLDVGRGVFTGDEKRAALRCLGLRLSVKNGIGTFDPLLIDTSRSQTRAIGRISLKDEQIRAALYGAPKEDSILRTKKPIPVTGTIKAPQAHAPKDVKSVGGVLGMIGDAITGDQRPLASNIDCDALKAQVLGS